MIYGSPPAPHHCPDCTTAATAYPLTFGIATAPTAGTTTPIAAPTNVTVGGTTTNNDLLCMMEAMMVTMTDRLSATID